MTSMTTTTSDSPNATPLKAATFVPAASKTADAAPCRFLGRGCRDRALTYRVTADERVAVLRLATRLMTTRPWLSRNAIGTEILFTMYGCRDEHGRIQRDLDGAVTLLPATRRPSRAQLNYLLRRKLERSGRLTAKNQRNATP